MASLRAPIFIIRLEGYFIAGEILGRLRSPFMFGLQDRLPDLLAKVPVLWSVLEFQNFKLREVLALLGASWYEVVCHSSQKLVADRPGIQGAS